MIKFAADTVQPLFNSREEYYDSYAMGRKLWLKSWGKLEEREHYMLKMQNHLKDAEKSFVNELPWEMFFNGN